MERGKFEWEVTEDEEEQYIDRMVYHSIFLIDAGPAMMKKVGKLSSFQSALKHLCEFLSSKIRVGDADQFAIVFFSTKTSKAKSSSSGVYTFQEMGKPDIQSILELQRFALDQSMFELKVGSTQEFSLFDALSEYSVLFRSSKVAKKTIYLITNEENPCAGNVNEYSKCTVKAKDLVDNDISLEVVGLDGLNKKFSFETFYSKLEYLHEEEFTAINADNEFKGLENLFKSKEHQKRTLISVPFNISDDLSIGIRGFRMFQEKVKPLYSYVAPVPSKNEFADDVGFINGSNLAAIESEVTYYCNTTAKKLDMNNDIDYYFPVGSKGERVYFTSKEVKQIKNSGPAGLTLLGFRPKEDLKPKFNMKASVFLVADESQFTGSSSLFAHLVERMEANNKIAFCKLITRDGSVSKLVALVPQLASYDPQHEAAKYEGFHMIYLPFADDIRPISHLDFEIPDDSHVTSAHKIISKLNDPNFEIGAIKNPVLDHHFNHIYALALEKDSIAATTDETLPDFERISIEAGEFIHEFNESTTIGIDLNESTKRAAQPLHPKEPKKPKVAKAKLEDAENDEAIMKAIANDALDKWTIPMLKKAIQRRDEKPKGKKKEDFIDQVQSLYF